MATWLRSVRMSLLMEGFGSTGTLIGRSVAEKRECRIDRQLSLKCQIVRWRSRLGRFGNENGHGSMGISPPIH